MVRSISGTPTTVGSYMFTIGVKDSAGQSNTAVYTFGVTGLSGQYFFYEQYYYDYYSQQSVQQASSKGHRGWPSRAMLQQAALHPEHHAAPRLSAQLSRMNGMHPTPAQGSFNSSIEWGSVAGSVTLDGSGNVTGGEYDENSSYGTTSGTITGGSYGLSGNSSGTLSLILDGNAGPQFFVGAHALNGKTFANQTAALAESTTDGATYIEYGDGQLMLQTGSALGTPLASNWVFGLRGETCYECDQSATGDLLTAGLLNFDGAGSVTNTSVADVTTGFDTDTGVALAGTIGTTPDAFGRTTVALSSNTYGDGALPVNYVVYTIDATHAYVISVDQIGQSLTPYLYGPLDQQAQIDFEAATVSGNYVVWGSGEDVANETTPDSTSDTQISLLTADGSGNVSGSGDFNYAGSVETGVAYSGTYAVAANGNVSVNGGGDSGAVHKGSYVGHPSQGTKSHTKVQDSNDASYSFWMASDTQGFGLQLTYGDYEPAAVTIGQQSSGTFSNASLSGSYGVGSEFTATSNSLLVAGTAAADGAGNLTGSLGVSSNAGYGNGSISATYTVGSNGRGTASGTANSLLSSTTFYIVSSGEIVATDTSSSDPAPGIIDIQQ